MIRKMLLGAAAAVAIGFGTQTASAGEPVFAPQGGSGGGYHSPRVDYDYIVFVKRGHHGDWEFYGRFETMHEARRVERRLEDRGYRVRIEEVRDRRDRRW